MPDPTSIQITGLLAAAGNARGAYPVRVVSQVANAVWMRLGNTAEELQLADWRAYSDDVAWLLPTGQQPKVVHAEYRLADLSLVSLQAAVPDFDTNAGTDYVWPGAPDPMDAQGQWHQDFSTGADYWAVYDYFDGVHPDNIYYPATWVSTGGSDGGGYILADDSRWRIDTPEDPDVLFPLAIRSEWVDPRYLALNFDGFSVDFNLKGEALDLLGGQAYLYIFDAHGRVVKFDQPLSIGNGQWAHNRVVIDSLNDDAWDVTFLPHPGLIDGSLVHSWGITFAGFSGEPTGVLALDEFSITWTPRDTSPTGLATTGSQITVKRDLGTVQDQLASCALVGGGFVTAWRETALDGSERVVVQQSFADGGQGQPRFLAEAGAAGAQSQPALAALADGGFALAWHQVDALSPSGSILLARTFDASGSAHVPAFAVADVHTSPGGDAALTGLAGGGFAVTWTAPALGGPGANEVWLRSYSGHGPDSAAAAVQLGSSGQAQAPALAVAQGAGLVLAWPDGLSGNPSGSLTIQLVTVSGQALRTVTVLPQDSAATLHGVVAASLPDGRWVLAWAENNAGVERLWAQVHAADGSSAMPALAITTLGTPTDAPLAVTTLDEDRFLIGWTVPVSVSRSEVHGRVYTAVDGSAQSAEWVLQDPGPASGNKQDLLALTLTDGRALLTWADSGLADGAAGTAVLAQVVELRQAGQALTGSAAADDWVGTPWNDQLSGMGGLDRLAGGAGDDTYQPGSADATLVERANQGTFDSVLVAFDYRLASGVHIERIAPVDPMSTAPLQLAGNEFANTVQGNAGDNSLNYLAGDGPADTLVGGAGDDWYFVYRTGDQVLEDANNGLDRVFTRDSYTLAPGQSIEVFTTDDHAGTAPVVLVGNELANNLYGNAGHNTLDGGAGIDSMAGLAGDDFYFVDHPDDVVAESAGEGYDRVFAGVHYALAPGQSIEKLTTDNNAATVAINLTGNELGNVLYGNAGANVLDGRGGMDVMVGSTGDDWYHVDQSNDVVLEWAGQGWDRVLASADYRLAPGQSIEKLTTAHNQGDSSINLTGNELDNELWGNAGANWLDGQGGVDTLIGSAGDDWYFVDHADDFVQEQLGEGADRVLASVNFTLLAGQEIEKLTTTDNLGTSALQLAGNEFSNAVYGNRGDNTLDGKLGNDTLVGMGGNDVFQFSTALGPGNLDTVIDFDFRNDRIVLDHRVFTGLEVGALPLANFREAWQSELMVAQIVLDTDTATLYFDADGGGGEPGIPFLVIPGAWVSADHFWVV